MATVGPSLSPHACARCKFSHKKCDRVTPICSNCSKRNKECHYEIEHVVPKKRGRKPKEAKKLENNHSFSYQPYPIPNKPAVIQEPNVVTNFTQVSFERHFEDYIKSCPLLDKHTAAEIIKFKKCAENGVNQQSLDKVPSNEDLLVFFSMQAMFYQKIHMTQLAKRCFDMSRSLLANLFDKSLTSLKIASAFHYLFVYCDINMDLDRAAFYLENANAFINRWKNRIPDKEYENTIEGQIYVTRVKIVETYNNFHLFYANDDDLIGMLKRIIYITFVYRHYFKLVEKLEGNTQPSIANTFELQDLLPFLAHIKQDINENTNHHFRLDIPMLDRLCAKYEMVYQESLASYNSKLITVMLIFVYGSQIQILSKEGKWTHKIVRHAADRISNLVHSDQIFNLAHIRPLFLSMHAHLHCLLASKNLQERELLVQIVKSNVKSVRVAMETNPRLRHEVSAKILNLESVVAEQEERIREEKLNASLRLFATSPMQQQQQHQQISNTSDSNESTPEPINMTLDDNFASEVDMFLQEFLNGSDRNTQSEQDRSVEAMLGLL